MRKGVEGLPLKYIIIVIVALLVLDLILELTGVIRGGVIASIMQINNTVTNISSGL